MRHNGERISIYFHELVGLFFTAIDLGFTHILSIVNQMKFPLITIAISELNH